MSDKKTLNRRNFLGGSVAGLIGTSLLTGSGLPLSATENEKKSKIKEYRILGKTGFKTSDIAFGAGLLANPTVLEAALDMGINYIDTGEHYMGGRSEKIIGEVVKNRERKSLFITTKINLNFGGAPTKVNIKNRFYKCLERLQTDYADCLMMHMAKDIEQLKHPDFHQAVNELKKEGKVKFCGVSNHGPKQSIYGKLEVPMEKVLVAAAMDGRFDVMLLVYNFLQKEQGEKIIDACQAKNIGVTLMKTNPVKVYSRWKEGIENRKKRGGKISERLIKMDKDYKTWLDGAEKFKTKYGLKNEIQIRDAALKFVLSNPKVQNACISIGNFDDLNNFVKLSGEKLKNREYAMLNDYESLQGSFYCKHACGECESKCKKAVPVNTIMRYHHYFEAQGREKHSMNRYASLGKQNAKDCLNCSGDCQKACPYNVPIQSLLINAHQTLSLT